MSDTKEIMSAEHFYLTVTENLNTAELMERYSKYVLNFHLDLVEKEVKENTKMVKNKYGVFIDKQSIFQVFVNHKKENNLL